MIGLPAILAAAGLYFLTRGSSGPSGWNVLPYVAKKYRSERNDRMILIISEMFGKAGLPFNAAAAAVVNAWAESGLNPNENTGDGGHSIGLFQLNDVNGAGNGLTVAYRQNPVNNTRVILEREVLTKRGALFRRRAAEGADIAELAAIFARDIERPANKPAAMAKRASIARSMFPTLAKKA